RGLANPPFPLRLYFRTSSIMTLLKIARMGHPVLSNLAQPIDDPTDARIRRLVDDMADTMADAEGIGLAAPQVYQSLRLILFLDIEDRDEPDRRPPIPLINPVIEPIGDRVVAGLEGCLSIPGLRGMVPRYERIGYRGLSPEGKLIEREASGLHARVVQHEVDHLDGVLYTMRMPDLSLLSFESELRHLVAAVEQEQAGEEEQAE
ncbi:MAG: peptide deformylase, partial [Pseudomonadota bacterium]